MSAAVGSAALGVGSPAEALGSAEVLIARGVVGLTDVSTAIARFIALEVIERLRSAVRQRAMVAVTRIVAIVDVAVEAGVPVEPGAGADEDPAVEPVGTVVAVGGAVIGGVIEVAVGAIGRGSNRDGDLGGRVGGNGAEERGG